MLKKKYIVSVLLFFVIVLSVYYIKENIGYTSTVDVRQVFSVADLKSNCNIDKIMEETDKCSIKVYYPVTAYEDLNSEVLNKVNAYIDDFKKEIEPLDKREDMKYKLEINFNSYEYSDYISYVFNVFIDLLGAHPNNFLFSISYNVSSKSVIKIQDLLNINKELLNVLSEYSYNELKDNENIQKYAVEGMLEEGLEKKIDNFDTFAFDNSGFKIFFEKYSVAPYVAGEFIVTIPYDKLGLKI